MPPPIFPNLPTSCPRHFPKLAHVMPTSLDQNGVTWVTWAKKKTLRRRWKKFELYCFSKKKMQIMLTTNKNKRALMKGSNKAQ